MTEETFKKASGTVGRLVRKFKEETGRDSDLLFSRNRYMGHEPSYMLLLRDAVVQYPQNVTDERAMHLMHRCEGEVEMEIRDHRSRNS
jgi:hypothetical protein